MKKEAIVSAADLTIGYRTGRRVTRVHEHLSFRLYPGELTCLLGANGMGKSTLLRTLAASQPALFGGSCCWKGVRCRIIRKRSVRAG